MRMPLLFTGVLTELASVVRSGPSFAVVARAIFVGVLIAGVPARLRGAASGLEVGIAARDITPAFLPEQPIQTGRHCFACTAGGGSSCTGALAD